VVYRFYKKCHRKIHGIPISDAAKYLEITSEKKFIDRLKENYSEQIDYIIMGDINKKSIKGVKHAYYFISFDCFEKICMNSRTKKKYD